jgi:MHS family proline/betaine transporter-like MFS transporter
MIEWYDFFIFGSLATILQNQFFDKNSALLQTLGVFAVGFLFRPFGALVFGRLGDMVGRKFTFLLTLITMGLCTFLLGLVPTFAQIGYAATAIVLVLRILQGLALGGEYGGAATYVAEHAPEGSRGYHTSFIQTTATFGLFLSLIVILVARTQVGEGAFNQWAWRIPFLLSAVLVIISITIRLRMVESPMFSELKAAGKTSAHPIKESFENPANRRLVLIALFGATMGQGVVWYTSQFYSMLWLQSSLHVQAAAVSKLVACALLVATPFFVVFGKLSDRIGRKKLMMAGCLLAAVGYIPIYSAMRSLVPNVKSVIGTPATTVERAMDPITMEVSITEVQTIDTSDGMKYVTKTPVVSETDLARKPTLKPKTEITPNAFVFWLLSGLVFLQVLFVTMVYGPIAAFLVELFPTRIRYTSMSLPYHLGNGVFGGLVPLIGTSLVGLTGNNLAGLWFPIGIAAVTFIVGSVFIHERPVDDGFVDEAVTNREIPDRQPNLR